MIQMTEQLDQMRKMTEDLVEAYCTRVATVSELIGEAYEMMERNKKAQEEVRRELREKLASMTSLRRKDFDAVMRGVLEPQFAREKQIKEDLHRFFEAQKALSARLRKALQMNNLDDVHSIKGEMERETSHIKQMVGVFHDQQTSLLQRLKSLLKRGVQLTVTEFKEAMSQIRKELVVAGSASSVRADRLIDTT